MPRAARVTDLRMPHHITQRGNYRQKVFDKEEDFKVYIDLINECSGKYGLRILAYCLMNNHVHFIAIPMEKESLSGTFKTTHMRYSQYFNKKKKASGHLWQGRFYSSILDEQHLIEAVRYVERNPVRAKLVKNAWDWKWSSAGAHVGKREADINLAQNAFLKEVIKDNWKQYLSQKDEAKYVNELRRLTKVGRPFVGEKTLKSLEDKFKMKLKSVPRGRPKKKTNE